MMSSTERITPEMFFTDEPPERIIGTEVEYDLQTPVNEYGQPAQVYRHISQRAIEAAGYRTLHGFLDNGMRIYEDCEHPEGSSAESLGPYQAAAADIATMFTMANVIEASGRPHHGLYRVSGVTVNDRILKYTQQIVEVPPHDLHSTAGVHENFMAPSRLASSRLLHYLLPSYYATRLSAMGGTVIDNKYHFSQKVRGIGGTPIEHKLERRASTSSKPMATVHVDDGQKTGKGWLRLETRFADAPMSLESRRHALGTTSLVLRMIEQFERKDMSMFKPDDFDRLIIKYPVDAAHQFMSDLSLESTVEVKTGEQLRMIDIMELFTVKSAFLRQRIALPKDEIQSALVWERLVEAWQRSRPDQVEYDDYLLRNFSVATKHYWLHRKGYFTMGNDESQTRSMQWDRVLPVGSGLTYFQKKYGEEPEIETLQDMPPAQTRAAKRGKFITNHADDEQQAAVSSWAVGYNKGGHRVVFSDPYGYPVKQMPRTRKRTKRP